MQRIAQQKPVTKSVTVIDAKGQMDITYLLSQGGMSVSIVLSLTIFISITLLRVSQLTEILLSSEHKNRKRNQ